MLSILQIGCRPERRDRFTFPLDQIENKLEGCIDFDSDYVYRFIIVLRTYT